MSAAQCTPGRPLVAAPGILHTLELLLRDRHTLAVSIEHDERLQATARAMLVSIALCTAIFGAVLGCFRGGMQILYASLKLPLVTLLTVALVAPLLGPLQRLLHRPSALRRDITLLLSATALSSLVLAVFSPVVLLAVKSEVSYHMLILMVVAICGFAGALGLKFLWYGFGLRAPVNLRMLGGLLLAFLVLVGSQLAWTLRPYLVRPRTEQVPFVRNLEGSFIGSVVESTTTVVFGSSRRAPLVNDEEKSRGGER